MPLLIINLIMLFLGSASLYCNFSAFHCSVNPTLLLSIAFIFLSYSSTLFWSLCCVLLCSCLLFSYCIPQLKCIFLSYIRRHKWNDKKQMWNCLKTPWTICEILQHVNAIDMHVYESITCEVNEGHLALIRDLYQAVIQTLKPNRDYI